MESRSVIIPGPSSLAWLQGQAARDLLIYDLQALSLTGLRRGEIISSQLGISIPTKQVIGAIKQVGIVPRKGYYVVEVIYACEPVPAAVDLALCAGIDVGLNTLAALPSNKAGFVLQIVNGRRQGDQSVLQQAPGASAASAGPSRPSITI